MSNQDTNAATNYTSEMDKPTLNTGLNVLTILTFIGSGIQLLFTVFGFFSAEKSYEQKDKVIEQMNSPEMPAIAKSMMPDAATYEALMTKSFENRLPILVLGLAAIFLCIYGAMQMRKLKKQGFTFYLIGQGLPFISSALFLGMFAFSGVMAAVMIGITLLFVLLYFMQKKNLVY